MKHNVKKHFILFMAALTFATSSGAVGVSVNTMNVKAGIATHLIITNKNGCPLKEGCTKSSRTLKHLSYLAQVEDLGKKKTNEYGNVWFFVKYNGKAGWVYSGNVNNFY